MCATVFQAKTDSLSPSTFFGYIVEDSEFLSSETLSPLRRWMAVAIAAVNMRIKLETSNIQEYRLSRQRKLATEAQSRKASQDSLLSLDITPTELSARKVKDMMK